MLRLLTDAWKTGSKLKLKGKMSWMPIEHLRNEKALLFLILLAAFPLLGFQFGSGNQVEQFAIIARMMDSAFAPGDFYTDHAVGFGPRFYYSKFMAVLVGVTSFPFAILLLSVLCNFATGVVTYLSARRLVGVGVLGAAAAATLAVVNGGFALGLAGYIRFDSFQPASIAIPISLAGVYFSFTNRAYIAAIAFALASLFHPLIGVEVGLAAFGAYFLSTVFNTSFDKQLWRAVKPQIFAGLVFVGLVFAAWGAPSLFIDSEKISDKEFFETLISFRAPHHYLALSFPQTHYVSFFWFAASIGAIIIWRIKEESPDRAIQSLIIAAFAIIALCAVSIVFVDMMESRLFATAQVFRMLFLVKWIGYLFVGWAMTRWIADHGPIGFLFAALALISTAEAQGRALALIVSLGWVATRKPFSQKPTLKWALAAVAFGGAIYFHKNYGVGTEAVRASAAVGVMFLLFVASINDRMAMTLATAATSCAILFAAVNSSQRWIDKDALTPEFSWAYLSGDDIDIAQWARSNTPEDSIWATPPDFEAFRLIAERGIVADYTSIPFQDLALRAWKDRMITLYGPVEGAGFRALRHMRSNYAEAESDQLRAAMAKFDADHAVLYAATPWDGPILYQNETYKAVRR